MKELNDDNAKLVQHLADRVDLWGRDAPKMRLWTFYVGDDRAAAKAWRDRHGLEAVNFGMVSPGDSGLEKWNLDGVKSNALVLAGKDKKVKGTWTGVTAGDVKDLGRKLQIALNPEA